MKPLRAASFFSGIGGIDIALAAAGFDIVLQCEIDEHCQVVLRKHRQYWRNAQLRGDIRRVTGKTKRLKQIDLIAGGFPCQDISIAGQRRGIERGNRSGLWYELARVIREARPRAVLLENVANITAAGKGGDIVTAQLAAMGYDAVWLPVRAADVYAPHRRERWFCVAVDHTRRNRRYMGQSHYPSRQPVRHQKRNRQTRRKPQPGRNDRHAAVCRKPKRRLPKPRMDRKLDGVPGWLDGFTFPVPPNTPQPDTEPPRLVDTKGETDAARIQALGNAVVPQQVYPFALALFEYLS